VGGHFFFVNFIFHVVARLVDSEQGKTVEDTRMNLFSAIGNDTDNDLEKKDC
jgi:hypothetical protein